MQSISLEQPGQLALKQAARPARADDQALVRIRRIGVCGTDLHAYRGRQPFFSYPRILGHELSAEIIELPANDRGLVPGQRCAIEPYLNCGSCIACRHGKTNCCVDLKVLGVHIDGGMCEYLNVPIDKLHPSASLTLDQLALVEPLSIGAHAVARAQLTPGETVLVIGAGPIGLSVIQFALLSNVRVVVVDVNEDRLRFCQQHYAVTNLIGGQTNVLTELRSLTAGDLPTAVFDATGNPVSMGQSFQYVAHGGRLIFVGLFPGDITFHDPEFHRREMTILSSRNSTGDDFRRIIGQLEAGQIRIDPWISHRVDFPSLVTEFPNWLTPQAGFIKGLVEL